MEGQIISLFRPFHFSLLFKCAKITRVKKSQWAAKTKVAKFYEFNFKLSTRTINSSWTVRQTDRERGEGRRTFLILIMSE